MLYTLLVQTSHGVNLEEKQHVHAVIASVCPLLTACHFTFWCDVDLQSLFINIHPIFRLLLLFSGVSLVSSYKENVLSPRIRTEAYQFSIRDHSTLAPELRKIRKLSAFRKLGEWRRGQGGFTIVL